MLLAIRRIAREKEQLINRNHKNNKNCYVSVCRYVCTNIYAAVVVSLSLYVFEVALFIGVCVYIFYLFTDIICIYYKYLFIILLRFSSVCSIFFVVCCCRVVSSMSVCLSFRPAICPIDDDRLSASVYVRVFSNIYPNIFNLFFIFPVLN